MLTFELMHVYTNPAEDMSTKCHLWSINIILQANATVQILLSAVHHLFYEEPFTAFSTDKFWQLGSIHFVVIDTQHQSRHKALLPEFRVDPNINKGFTDLRPSSASSAWWSWLADRCWDTLWPWSLDPLKGLWLLACCSSVCAWARTLQNLHPTSTAIKEYHSALQWYRFKPGNDTYSNWYQILRSHITSNASIRFL